MIYGLVLEDRFENSVALHLVGVDDIHCIEPHRPCSEVFDLVCADVRHCLAADAPISLNDSKDRRLLASLPGPTGADTALFAANVGLIHLKGAEEAIFASIGLHRTANPMHHVPSCRIRDTGRPFDLFGADPDATPYIFISLWLLAVSSG